eukprot:3056171-Prymnesium_polylepis.1
MGSYCKEGASSPLGCPRGRYSNATNLERPEQCSTCPPHHQCSTGSVLPQSCQPGSHAPYPGSWECVRCPHGSFQSVAGEGAISFWPPPSPSLPPPLPPAAPQPPARPPSQAP